MSTSISLLEVDNTDSDDEESASAPSRTHIIFKAVCFLIGGLVISAVIAYPLVDSISNLSKASGISPFFISSIAMPLPTAPGEVISSHAFAKGKKKSYMSMAYYQVPYLAVSIMLVCVVFCLMAQIAVHSAAQFFRFYFVLFEFCLAITFLGMLIVVISPKPQAELNNHVANVRGAFGDDVEKESISSEPSSCEINDDFVVDEHHSDGTDESSGEIQPNV